ncbi:unnamed protein product [Candidula unifasciata]|uniref:PPM-type phosphatase domain-containing protein n=1 Tax=Candidula unifasciata TaxID=100452 RepID=A0A8S3ZQ28_9EUPU|nr:unnamed protein product [Candidula unifasciata]
MTSHRIGVNLRVSGNCDQGARKYMEDNHVIKFLKKDTEDYEFAYFGIFDGHGGPEASTFCKDNLLNEITKYSGFWTDDDEQVLQAIKKGFLDTHNAMWNVLDSWPKTPTGLPSTAGSTATIAIIKQGKLYTGHVGDSALVLGEMDVYARDDFPYQAVCITKEHKPDDPDERLRIEDAGGEVINKSGVPRVVWSRPKTSHKGPVRRSTQIDQIPFLAVARSLGDLWSYDYYTETYVVSPEPDVSVLQLDPSKHRCIILASDGLWNMLTPEETVNIVMDLEAQFEQKIISDPNVAVSFWSNPAEHLVSRALNKWRAKSLKADNTSCVVVLIDPLGPSKLTLLRRRRQALLSGGEMTGQLTKIPTLSTDIDHRSKGQNKNVNCSLSDSHIRVNDDSILRPALVKEHVAMSAQRSSGSKPELTESDEESDTFSYPPKPPVKWNLRQQAASDRNQSLNTSSSNRPHNQQAASDRNQSLNASSTSRPHNQHGNKHLNNSQRSSPSKGSNRQAAAMFTKLADPSRTAHSEKGSCERREHVNSVADSIYEDIEDESNGDSGSDYEKTLPKPPPSTPCTGANAANTFNESSKEDSLHSSADVTDKAFALASDESIQSPGSSFGSGGRPRTPMSAPAKLSGARRSHISKRAKKKLVKSGKKFNHLAKVHAVQNTTTVKSTNTDQGTSSLTHTHFSKIKSHDDPKTSKMVSVATAAVGKNLSLLHIQTSTHAESPPRHVLNTSRSMNHIVTPRNQKEAARSISCSGLTPEMSLLMSAVSKSALNHTIATSTTNSDITSQLFSTLMDAGIGDSLRSRRETCVVVDDTGVSLASSSVLTQTEPLKQLNKTVSLHKTGSKRWGNFFRASKLGIDQMLHLGSHRKGSVPAGGKFTSAGTLECGSSKLPSNRNTSMSTSRLADITLSNHLPDVTVSHMADFTLNTSTLTAGDLTNLSALSADDDVLSADDLSMVHHSMIDADSADKASKKRKGFLQKTRVTLSRARKAAKKAFFPENHRLFNKTSGNKRRSDEFLPTPEQKRRRQLDADKSTIS